MIIAMIFRTIHATIFWMTLGQFWNIFLSLPNLWQQRHLVAASAILKTHDSWLWRGLMVLGMISVTISVSIIRMILGTILKLFFCLSLMCNNSAAWLQPPPYWRLMIHGCGEGRRSHHFYIPASNQAVRSRKIPTPKRQADRAVGTPLVPRANGPTFL